MSRALDLDRPAPRGRRAHFWPDAQSARKSALERHPFAAGWHPGPDLDRRDWRGADRQPAARRAFVGDSDFAALRASPDLRGRGGRRGAWFDGPLRDPLSDPMRTDPYRHRRSAVRGGVCFAADKLVTGAGLAARKFERLAAAGYEKSCRLFETMR